MCECDKLKYWKGMAYILAVVILLFSIAYKSKNIEVGEKFRELFNIPEDEEKKFWFRHVDNTI